MVVRCERAGRLAAVQFAVGADGDETELVTTAAGKATRQADVLETGEQLLDLGLHVVEHFIAVEVTGRREPEFGPAAVALVAVAGEVRRTAVDALAARTHDEHGLAEIDVLLKGHYMPFANV